MTTTFRSDGDVTRDASGGLSFPVLHYYPLCRVEARLSVGGHIWARRRRGLAYSSARIRAIRTAMHGLSYVSERSARLA